MDSGEINCLLLPVQTCVTVNLCSGALNKGTDRDKFRHWVGEEDDLARVKRMNW